MNGEDAASKQLLLMSMNKSPHSWTIEIQSKSRESFKTFENVDLWPITGLLAWTTNGHKNDAPRLLSKHPLRRSSFLAFQMDNDDDDVGS